MPRLPHGALDRQFHFEARRHDARAFVCSADERTQSGKGFIDAVAGDRTNARTEGE